MSTILRLSHPASLNKFYHVPADRTHWQDGDYRKLKTAGWTPARAPASFGCQTAALQKNSAVGLERQYGIYVLGFTVPSPALYVGIAARSRVPEGIDTRLRKHRIKVTGSHVGSAPDRSGVNHTRQWREFAPERYRHFATTGCYDDLDDAMLLTGDIEGLEDIGDHKKVCEYFEHMLVNDVRYFEILTRALLGVAADEVFRLNSGKGGRGQTPAVPGIDFWGSSTEWISGQLP
ncbi:hypothetical protein ACPPVV_02160 [Rhodanobacter sp. Col0626]|uniref:hypothetical protein n=1 Tax=Rhodanobacter sp. Col0626 TaxID=3415679 RepID=UPI003CF60822